MLVSVVVCTRNRSQSLKEAVYSLMQLQTNNRFDYEILVVNNNSTDDTSLVVNQLSLASSVPIREVLESQAGIVFARNRGINESRGEWIAFFDDDQLADPNWLLELLKTAQAENVRCVGGAVVLKLPAGYEQPLSPICRMLLGESVGLTTSQPYNPKQTPGAGNMMIHRSVFQNIGVFDPAYNRRGEDTNLYLRMHAAGLTAWFTPSAIVHHVIPESRLTTDYLLRVSQIMSEGMAIQERDRVGRILYPFFWLARLTQAACLITPRYVWSIITRNRPTQIGLRCRLQIASGYLHEGFPLLWVLS